MSVPFKTRRRFDDLPPSQQAGILSQTEAFQRFAGARLIGRGIVLDDVTAADFIRTTCNITSRRDLDTNPDAAARFAALRTDYDAERGKIPRP